MFCAARSMPTSLQSVGDKPMKDGFAWGSRGLVIICGANFGRVEQWWVSMSDFFFQFLSRLNISEKCQTSMVYEQRTPPKKNNLAHDLWVQNGANKRLEFQIHVYSVENIVTHHMFTKALIADLGHGIL